MGHITEPDKKCTKAADGGIRKERFYRAKLRKTIIADKEIDKKLKIILLDSLNGTILIYGLNEI